MSGTPTSGSGTSIFSPSSTIGTFNPPSTGSTAIPVAPVGTTGGLTVSPDTGYSKLQLDRPYIPDIPRPILGVQSSPSLYQGDALYQNRFDLAMPSGGYTPSWGVPTSGATTMPSIDARTTSYSKTPAEIFEAVNKGEPINPNFNWSDSVYNPVPNVPGVEVDPYPGADRTDYKTLTEEAMAANRAEEAANPQTYDPAVYGWVDGNYGLVAPEDYGNITNNAAPDPGDKTSVYQDTNWTETLQGAQDLIASEGAKANAAAAAKAAEEEAIKAAAIQAAQEAEAARLAAAQAAAAEKAEADRIAAEKAAAAKAAEEEAARILAEEQRIAAEQEAARIAALQNPVAAANVDYMTDWNNYSAIKDKYPGLTFYDYTQNRTAYR